MGNAAVTILVSVAAGVAAQWPASAPAAPPVNDNYLSSTTMRDARGGFPTNWHDVQNTVDASVQTDLFNPDRDGLPFFGGPPEDTQCGPSAFGKTVWYDLAPPLGGGAELTATGFDTVIAVYEYNPETAAIVRRVTCLNASSGPSEDLPIAPGILEGGHAYTAQIGGVAAPDGTVAAGTLDYRFQYFPDRDGDGVLDSEPDVCLELPGIHPSGCPPELNTVPRYRWSPASGGIRLDSLTVLHVPAGARVIATCARCRITQVVRPARASDVRLSLLIGRTLPLGAVIEIRVTKAPDKSGKFRFGAIGNYFRYPVTAKGLGTRVDRCLLPGATTPKRTCR